VDEPRFHNHGKQIIWAISLLALDFELQFLCITDRNRNDNGDTNANK
jgi:hypothetical protein